MTKVYWRTRKGELIDVDDMDINHLRNTLKMLIRNKIKQVNSQKKRIAMQGDIAQEVADLVELHNISPELTCCCDNDYVCQQCFEE